WHGRTAALPSRYATRPRSSLHLAMPARQLPICRAAASGTTTVHLQTRSFRNTTPL
ncbi:MAG: hypothetical protein AVDCRST_MAG42-2199, partial [uncultured Chthoniobacterales bacterium]